MKKKIALFANGWTTENLIKFTHGLTDNLPANFADTYMFVSHESYGMTKEERNAQNMIYKLPDLSTFDAAIIFYSGLNFKDSIDYIYEAVSKSGIPAISIGNPDDTRNVSIVTDNYTGMLELCNHMIDTHDCKSFVYIGGSEDNNDSNERLMALRDALNAHNLPMPAVYYSNWDTAIAKVLLQEHHCTKDTIPDAIICANDHLASFAVLAMEEKGFSVPDDVLVTGFDNIHRCQVFHPSISTVDQHYVQIGLHAAEAIVKLLNTQEPVENLTVPCSFMPSDSCGCQVSHSDELRKAHAHNFPYRDQAEYIYSLRMFAIEHYILQATDYQTLRNNLRHVFLSSSGPEGDSFFFMMDPRFKDAGKTIDYIPNRFCEEMDIIAGKRNGDEVDATTCLTKDLVPPCDIESNLIYTFTPVFHEDFMCGYLAFVNNVDLLDLSQIYNFTNKINRSLISLIHNLQLSELNIRLSELMEQDTLTRVKNRAAYEKYLKKLERDFIEGENPPFAVIYFDINNLKIVNDMYGHEKGDAYIKNSCRLICNTFKHSPVFRIGGDEFVSIIVNDDYRDRHSLLDGMKEHMKTLKSKGDSVPLTERISIASGMAEYDRTLDEDFASIFRRADEIMYENKYKMKKDAN